MKVYRVVDNSTPIKTTTSLEELGRLFLKLSKKYADKTSVWYYAEEETI